MIYYLGDPVGRGIRPVCFAPEWRAQRTNQKSPFTSGSKSCTSHQSTSLSGYYLKNADRLFERGLLVVLDPLEALCSPLPRRKRVNLLHQLENGRHLLGVEPVHLAAETRTKILAPIFTRKDAGKENFWKVARFFTQRNQCLPLTEESALVYSGLKGKLFPMHLFWNSVWVWHFIKKS